MILRHARTLVLILATAVTLAASGVALWESYHGLLMWALGHKVEGPKIWPFCVDAFIVLGECALFLAMVDKWSRWGRVWPWTVLIGGLVVSVAANMGHAQGVDWSTRATYAVPPLAAFVGMTVGLGILKRVVSGALDDRAAVPTRAAAALDEAAAAAWWKTAAAAAAAPFKRLVSAAAAVEREAAAAVEHRAAAAAAALDDRAAALDDEAAALDDRAAVDDYWAGVAELDDRAIAAELEGLPSNKKVAALVKKGITETTQLAQLTGLAERTARRYRNEATNFLVAVGGTDAG